MMSFLNNAILNRIIILLGNKGKNMKVLKTEEEYRHWIIEEHFLIPMEQLNCPENLFDYEQDILPFIENNQPQRYPCLAYNDDIYPQMTQNINIRYIYKEQFENIIAFLS